MNAPLPPSSLHPSAPRVAVVGSGIAGLMAAYRLRRHAHVTLLEAAHTFGGHSHTVDVTLPNAQGAVVTHGVDTGFLVMNPRTYPGMLALLDELGVDVAPSEMSFSVQVPQAGPHGHTLEWSGHNLGSVFVQPRNALRPQFWSMLRDILRFNRLATALATAPQAAPALSMPLGQWLQSERFGQPFVQWYLLPMLGCIWSCPTQQMLAFPVATLVHFAHNHNLLQISNRPQWLTVRGGSRRYVERMVATLQDARTNWPVQRITRHADEVRVYGRGKYEVFDYVVLACHSDQALAMLEHPSSQERRVLGAIGYQPNRAVLHTDTSVLPKAQAAWAAWNYHASGPEQSQPRVCLHYLINRLQPLPFAQPVVVSLNPHGPIKAQHVLAELDYAHPIFDQAAIAAQPSVAEIQGLHRTFFAGAWTGYGFHEDGMQSGVRAAQALLQWHAQAIPTLA